MTLDARRSTLRDMHTTLHHELSHGCSLSAAHSRAAHLQSAERCAWQYVGLICATPLLRIGYQCARKLVCRSLRSALFGA